MMKKFNLKKFLLENKLNKNLQQLNENSPGFDNRKFGDPLPTLESIKAAYEAKEAESKLNEAYEIGDEVILRGGSTVTDVLKVVDMRKMFGSDLMAYTVEFPDGHVAEYDETQLSLNPGFAQDLETRADDYFSEPLKESPTEAEDFILKVAGEVDGEGMAQIAGALGIDTSEIDLDDEMLLDDLYVDIEMAVKNASAKEIIRLANELKGLNEEDAVSWKYNNSPARGGTLDLAPRKVGQSIKNEAFSSLSGKYSKPPSPVTKDVTNGANKAQTIRSMIGEKVFKGMKEQYSTMGGYVELMDLDDHLDSIHYEFERWREGPSTEITDIEPAKEEVISYVVDYLRNTL